MAQSSSPTTTLDLHGKVVVDAISEVTLFLERIRRTRVDSSTGRSEGRNVVFVQIITGSGSVRVLQTYHSVFAFVHNMINLPPLAT
jgi:hypothetical protein